MSAAVSYNAKFSVAVSQIAGRFFLPAEFALMSADAESLDTLRRCAKMNDDALFEYTIAMKGRAVEKLLLLLSGELTERELDTLYKMIEIRASRRLIVLFWACFQYHHRDMRYFKVAKILTANAKTEGEKYPEEINLALSTGGSGTEHLAQRLAEQNIFISTFIAAERICDASPFCDDMITAYFERCDAGGFLLNEKKFAQLLFDRKDKLPYDIVSNYLTVLDETQYFFSVNTMMLERWGNPYSSADWHDISPKLKRKFINWTSYRKLVLHILTNRLKLKLLSAYIPYIRDIFLFCDNKIMVMDFGDFFVVDDCEGAPFSYYLSAALYGRVRENIESDKLLDVRAEIENIPHGRDFIIEENENDFMQLDYEDIGRLYIKDMLDIILGVKPDLRPSKQLIKNKKRGGKKIQFNT